MRSITKRLTCVNRGDDSQNNAAMQKIVDRYIAKMSKRGWTLVNEFRGNCFLKYEAVLELIK